ncbi:PAS domain-containing sensor histidine kinase [Chitinolyticbacter meiyuanensis]|uniref:PAS domain-containing sensor histidine kinase n=1 Tax=Chitinolyticbacter meiyuanensis TaxID=682798 RepID=UPI0011E60482|nr:PAS domain-containing sensor histidine kinase [Chitinolyticbacter meiyuanensis]
MPSHHSPLHWQGRLPWLLAHTAIGLVMLVLLGYAWMDYRQTHKAQESTLAQDLLWQQQGIRLHLQTNQNVLENLAYGLAAEALSIRDFNARADALMKVNPELLSVEYLDARNVRVGGLPVYSGRPNSLVPLEDDQLQEAVDGAAALGHAVYSNVIQRNEPMVVLVVPYFTGTVYTGAVLATYSLSQLLQQRIPWWMVQRYDLQLIDGRGGVLAPTGVELKPEATTQEVGFEPPGHGLKLVAGIREAPTSVRHVWLLASVIVLLALLWWMLLLLRQRMQERQQAEAALQDEMRFRAAMEDSLVTGLRAMDKDGRIIYVNPGFCRMVGWQAEELLGHVPPMPYWAPEALEECAAAYRGILEGQAPANGFQLRFMRRNGERFDVRLYSSRLVDGRGESRGWMASLYDVTEIKREREALAASRTQLLTVLEGLEAAVSVTDAATGRGLYRNRHHADTFALFEEGDYCLVPLLPNGSLGADCVDTVSGRWYHVQRRAIDWVDGRRVWLDIASDITEQRSAAEVVRLQSEKLQHTARLVSMGELASSLAHELNQPLAAIGSYAAAGEELLALEKPRVERAREVMVKMGEQARRAGQIIRGIRDFVAKRAPRTEPCRLDAVLAVPLQLLEPLTRQTRARISVVLPKPLPPFPGDAVMLEQVLFNLLKNGLEAMATMPTGHPRDIHIGAELLDDALEVSIADTGPGMPQASQTFQPFFSTKAEGLGVGLNICRSVLEQHRGHLRVEPNPGGGTRFICRLPLASELATSEET